VAIVSLDGASSWARAGLRAGDVIEGVNGEAVRKPEEFAALTGGREPLEVRILRSRAGVYGTVLVEVAIRRAD